MPIFKTTKNIFIDNGEFFDSDWSNYEKLQLPTTEKWNYSREMKIEDVDIWEVIQEGGGAYGVYAAWSPYAEFYMIRPGNHLESIGHGVETYYGPGSQKLIKKRMKELGYPLRTNKIWVDKSDMWLYQDKDIKTIIFK